MIWSSEVMETPVPTWAMSIATGAGVGAFVSVEVAVGLGSGVGNGVGVGVGMGVGVAGAGAVGVVAGVGVGEGVAVGVGEGVAVGVGVGTAVAVGSGGGTDVGVGVGVGLRGFVWICVGDAVGALVDWARGVIVDAADVSTGGVGSIVSSLPQPTDTIINSKMRRRDSQICCFSCHIAVVEMRCIGLLPLPMPFETADLLEYHTSVYSNCLLMRKMADWQFGRAPGCGRYEPLRGYSGGKYNAWYRLPSTIVRDGGQRCTRKS